MTYKEKVSRVRGQKRPETWYLFKVLLLNQLDLTRPPGLVDPGLQGTVHAQGKPPALAGDGLQPVAFLAFGRFGPK